MAMPDGRMACRHADIPVTFERAEQAAQTGSPAGTRTTVRGHEAFRSPIAPAHDSVCPAALLTERQA